MSVLLPPPAIAANPPPKKKKAPVRTAVRAPAPTPVQAAPSYVDNRPVTMNQFKQLVKIFKSVVNRVDNLEREVKDLKQNGGGGTGGGQNEVIDLSAPDSKVQSAPVEKAKERVGHGGMPSVAPDFKVYFDLDLVWRPGTPVGSQNSTAPFTFNNYHSFLFFEILPAPDLQFSFDVNPTPRYYELDYQVTPKLQMRIGKIWIPFDDLSPHNIFGGRTNVSKLQVNQGANPFLPDLWTELGIGAKYQLIETKNLTMEGHLYVTNGFASGTNDPTGSGNEYPDFSGAQFTGVADNNNDKAVGGRLHAVVGRKWGFGLSFYTGRWNPQSDPESKRLTIIGVDSQLRIRSTEIRVGLATMRLDVFPQTINTGSGPTLGPDTATRGGYYLEVGQKFGKEQTWKVLGRFGYVQDDSRVLDVADEQILGATVLWKPGLIEYSIEASRDLLTRPDKVGYNYVAGRVIMAF